MMQNDEGRGDEATFDNAPLPNRITRSTLKGCFGILCVFALPALLFVPLEAFHLSVWLVRLAPLLAIAVTVFGAWLLARVPADVPLRSDDPLRPLTVAGHSPLIERPAAVSNRIAAIITLLLTLLSLSGYVLVSVSSSSLLVGTLVTSIGGSALMFYGALAMRRQLPIPAWRWERLPIHGGIAQQAVPGTLLGFIAAVWALLLAASEGYVWAPIGVGLLIFGGALIGPIIQRLAHRNAQRT